MQKVLLDVKNLKVHYPLKRKAFRLRPEMVRAVDGVSFSVHENETFGIVGESGCGKTTVGKAILRLVHTADGEIVYRDRSIMHFASKAEEKTFRKDVQMIFQDPFSSLDPRYIVGDCIGEPLLVHGIGESKERKKRVVALMQEVGLREDQYTRFPHEFSGGQRQRIGVARALALEPSLIICDEPVSALDVSIQAQILNLMKALQQKHGFSYIFISHNLSVVKHICNRIAVMYLGNIVELSDTDDLFARPLHPYTTALLSAIPVPDPGFPMSNFTLEGDVPSPINPPQGCCFHTRCNVAIPVCSSIKPKLTETENGHFVACHLIHPVG